MLPLLTTLISVSGAPFVPSSREKVKKMINLANIKSGDKIFDLGAGDGRVIVEASKKGAIATGYEVSFPLILSFTIRKILNKTKSKMVYGNFWTKDYSDADVIFAYLLTRSMKRFEKEIYPKLKKGAKIISNAFDMPNIKPEKIDDGIYLYVKK